MKNSKIKKTYFYPVQVETHEEGGYHAKCPILQGAFADGENIEEAIENLSDVIKLILKYKEERNKKRIYVPSIPMKKTKILQNLNVSVTI